MSYNYDLADFKRYLNEKNSKYRVDGLIFWQNRIPLPIDLFNRIFDESDLIVTDYIYHIAASALTFSRRESFENSLSIKVTDLPKGDLKNRSVALAAWLEENLQSTSKVRLMAYEVADILGLDDFNFSVDKVAEALQHQGKKYARIFMPPAVKKVFDQIPNSEDIGADNTDMFGNVIADRYDIYRSGFSDALAIIFNALLDFRLLCTGRGKHLKEIRVIGPLVEDVDVRIGRTSDGALWEPGYEDDHYITLNNEHPLMRKVTEEQSKPLAEFLFFIGEFENIQFSDESKKLVENMRQTVSRSLWIKNE